MFNSTTSFDGAGANGCFS